MCAPVGGKPRPCVFRSWALKAGTPPLRCAVLDAVESNIPLDLLQVLWRCPLRSNDIVSSSRQPSLPTKNAREVGAQEQ